MSSRNYTLEPVVGDQPNWRLELTFYPENYLQRHVVERFYHSLPHFGGTELQELGCKLITSELNIAESLKYDFIGDTSKITNQFEIIIEGQNALNEFLTYLENLMSAGSAAYTKPIIITYDDDKNRYEKVYDDIVLANNK
jgi:hypothetical protein